VVTTLVGLILFGILTLVTSRERLEPALLGDGEEYLALANQIRAHWFVPPPTMNIRPPLYPTVIAVAGWLTRSDGLLAVRNLQILAWLLVGPLVALWVDRAGGGLLVGAFTGGLYYTLGIGLFFIKIIYAETITVTVAVAAGLALVWSMTPAGHAGAWRGLAAALALGAAHGRAVFQCLVPLYALFAVGAHAGKPRAAVRAATPFLVAGLVGLLPLYVAHGIRKGSPAFVNVTGHSLANYLGDRRLLGKFPPGHEAVEAVYAVRFALEPDRNIIGWWEVDAAWRGIMISRIGRDPPWATLDNYMAATAVAVLSRNPGYYVRRWFETWMEFTTAVAPAPVAGPWCPVTLARPLWVWFGTYLGPWIAFAVLAIELANVAIRGRGELVRVVAIVTYLAVALASTAIEPWPGQIRYRLQVEAFLLVALGLAAGSTASWARAAVQRTRRSSRSPVTPGGAGRSRT
jgi:hypothetical protein